jgi:hypothetical protein
MKPSQLARQKRALGLVDDGGAHADAVAAERKKIEAVELAPLRLDGKRRHLVVVEEVPEGSHDVAPAWRRRPAAAAFAAMMLVLLAVGGRSLFTTTTPDQPTLLPKGGASARLYVESDGAVRTWQPGDVVRAGERVSAELSADGPTHAYFTVVDRKGALLVAPERLLTTELDIAAGARGAFERSFALDTDDVGEQALVLACETLITESSDTAVRKAIRLVAEALQAGRSVAGVLPGCKGWLFPLRGAPQ